MDASHQAQKQSKRSNAVQNNNLSSFVIQNSGNPQQLTQNNNQASAQAKQTSSGNVNYSMRKSGYVTQQQQTSSNNHQSRNYVQPANVQQSRTGTRVNMNSTQQLSDQHLFVAPIQGQKSGKTRNQQARQHQQFGMSTLNSKINATLETDILPGVTNNASKAQFSQKMNKSSKIRSESNPAGNGVIGLPKPQTQQLGIGIGNNELRESQTLTDRQTLNTLSHQEYKARVGGAQQFATINSNRVNKPQFSAKNGIEPITQPKAPPQMQNLDMGSHHIATSATAPSSTMNHNNIGSSKPRGLTQNTRSSDVRSLDPAMRNISAIGQGGAGPSGMNIHGSNQNNHTTTNASKNLPPTSLHGKQSYLTKTQSIGNGHRQQALSLHQQNSSGNKQRNYNQMERRSIDTKGLSKDYYSAIERGSTSNMITQQLSNKQQQEAGGTFPDTSTNKNNKNGGNYMSAAQFNQKKQVVSRTNRQRRNHFGGTQPLNQGVISEEVPYPPNASSVTQNHLTNVVGNQSMSLTRNTSQIRTAHLLSSDENKKHTNSQTIQVEKSSSSAAFAKANDCLPLTDQIQASLKDGQSPEQRKDRRKAQISSAQRMKQLEGMARNKINLQHGPSQQREQSHDVATGNSQGLIQKKDNLLSIPNDDPLASGPLGASQTLNLAVDNQKQKDLGNLVGKQMNHFNSVKGQLQSNQIGSSNRFAKERKSQDDTPKDNKNSQQLTDAVNFAQVANRLTALPNKRIGSQELQAEKQLPTSGMLNSYKKAGANQGLRVGSFRQNHTQALATEHQRQKDELSGQDGSSQIVGHSPKNNNFIVSPRSSKTPFQNSVGKSLNSDEIQNNLAKTQNNIKPQGSQNKLFKSAQGNPFNVNPQADVNKKSKNSSEIAQAERSQTNQRMAQNDQSALKVRSINSRISHAKIQNSNDSNPNDTFNARRQSGSQPASGLRQNNKIATTNTSSTTSKKQLDVLPSTGGSDEPLPKSKTNQEINHSTNNNATSQANTEKSSKTAPASEMRIEFKQPAPVANPLKDFEPAKYASKTHGLITSYAANTHQGIQRNYNEDRVSIILNMTRPASRKDVSNWPKCSFFAIYDGHGGSACSDFLKDQLHLIIINQQSFPKDPAQALTTGCLEAERRFMENADRQTPMHERSGSCGIVVLIVGKECYVANVGDSRAIMSSDKGKKLFLLSRDHRPNEDYEVQRIVKNGGGIYQTQSIQNVTLPGEDKPQQHFILGPHRVIPGRLSVSRTFGDIEAKHPKYGGKEGVIIAQPEISQFSVRNDFHDFIVLGCDGIFDRLSNQQVLDACWDTINSIKSAETKQGCQNPKTVHQMSGAMADAIIKQAAIERSMDNLTIVIVSFENLQTFLQDRPKPTQLENHLFQIKEVESGATSTVVGPTPGLSDSQIASAQINNLSQVMSPGKMSNNQKSGEERPLSTTIEEVKTEDMEETEDLKGQRNRSITPSQKTVQVVSRTTNQSSAEKEKSGPADFNQNVNSTSSSNAQSAGRNRTGVKQMQQPVLKQNNMTRNKNNSDMSANLQVQTRNSERPLDATPSQRRRAEILPKLPQTNTTKVFTDGKKLIEKTQSSQLKSSNFNESGQKDQSTAALFNQKIGQDSPKPLKKAQIANYRFSKTAKLPAESQAANLRNSINAGGIEGSDNATPIIPSQQRSRMKSNLTTANQQSFTMNTQTSSKTNKK